MDAYAPDSGHIMTMTAHQPQAIRLPHPLLAHLEALIMITTVIHHPPAPLTLTFLVVGVIAVGVVQTAHSK